MNSSRPFAHPASPPYFTAVNLIAWKWPISILRRYNLEFCDGIWISKISQISSPTFVAILHSVLHYTRHSQIAGNEYADTLAKKDAKITQTHIRETSYHSIKLHLKQVFQSAYRQELGTKLFKKPRKQELAKIPDWPRRRAVAEFRLCVGHDCLGTHLHRTGIRPDPTACCTTKKLWNRKKNQHYEEV